MALKLEKIGQITVVDSKGKPSSFFQTLWQRTITAIETTVNSQGVQIALIQQALAAAAAAQTAAQAAQQTANDAQTSADAGPSGTAVNGSATDAASTVSSTVTWVAAPTVNLTGVSAGNLTVPGSGPIQDGNVTVTITNVNIAAHVGEYRIVEVIGGVDGTVYGPFSYVAAPFSDPETAGSYAAQVINGDSAAVAAINDARSSTGAVDYRLDFRRVSGPTVVSLAGYLYARRS